MKQVKVEKHSQRLLSGLKREQRNRIKFEAELSRRIARLFHKAERKIIANIRRMYSPDLLKFRLNDIVKPFKEIKGEYVELLLRANLLYYSKGYQLGEDSIKIAEDEAVTVEKYIDFNFDYNLFMIDDEILYTLQTKTFQASQKTMNRLSDDIMQVLSEAYEEGIGVSGATQKVQERFTLLKHYEAERIARTEINTAQNLGSLQCYLDNGVKYHQWWTADDERVRNNYSSFHEGMHAQITNVGGYFSNNLTYPGDTNGVIGEWINCRCTIVPYFIPLGYTAPQGASYFYESDLLEVE